jgi:hypothetical protein
MTPREYTWGTIGKGYILGTGPIACLGLHGLYGHWNDAASVGSDIQNNVLDLTKYTWFLPQLPVGDNDWGKNDLAANFKVIQLNGFTSVHICGDSLGGMATIRVMAYNEDPTITNWPHLEIKSAGVVCGKDDRKCYAAYGKVKIKMWHGTLDTTMRYSLIVNMYNAVKAIGGDIELVSLTGVKHNAWDYGFNPTYPGNYFEWLNNQCN